MTRLLQVGSLVAGTLLIAPARVWACPVCFGDPSSPMTHGMNWAIIALLGVTGTVLGGFVAFFLYLFKRSRMMMGQEVGGTRSAHSGGGY